MSTSLAYQKEFAFNAICPYYTMFPLEYPMRIIRKHLRHSTIVLDPFCGRGTTIYAARRLGVLSYGFDTSPIAVAIAQAKLASASVDDVVGLAETLIAKKPKRIPETPFFRRAYAKHTLTELCSLREGLLQDRGWSSASAILRATILGCLHGPLLKGEGTPSYFSNQMPRTFASKPDYSVRFWTEKELFPPAVSAIDVIRKKISRITDLNSDVMGSIRNVKSFDARKAATYRNIQNVSLTITSPPYYGMRTYVQDQWLRMWFLGGDEKIDYETKNQICHNGHDAFIADLAKVWTNVHRRSKRNAHLYVRFGALPSAKSDPKKIMMDSLDQAGGWKLASIRNAFTAEAGRRQADQMGNQSAPAEEYDFHATRI